jgi:hypothetical protein
MKKTSARHIDTILERCMQLPCNTRAAAYFSETTGKPDALPFLRHVELFVATHARSFGEHVAPALAREIGGHKAKASMPNVPENDDIMASVAASIAHKSANFCESVCATPNPWARLDDPDLIGRVVKMARITTPLDTLQLKRRLKCVGAFLDLAAVVAALKSTGMAEAEAMGFVTEAFRVPKALSPELKIVARMPTPH